MTNPFITTKRRINYLIYKLSKVALSPRQFVANLLDSGRVQKILNRNKKLKNKFKGKRCFIIGNGSSLKKMNLKRLKNEYTFVVNNFIAHKDFTTIKPKFYVNIEPVSSLLSFKKTNYYHPDNYYYLIDKTVKKTGSTVFFDRFSESYINKNSLFKKNKRFYISSGISIFMGDKLGYEDDITHDISFCDSVIPAAICIAVYMGFKEIYLIGCDEDFVNTNGKELHFYKDKTNISANINNSLSMEELTYAYHTGFKRWRLIRDHFITKGVNIMNAGVDSKIDAFPKVNFKKLTSNE